MYRTMVPIPPYLNSINKTYIDVIVTCFVRLSHTSIYQLFDEHIEQNSNINIFVVHMHDKYCVFYALESCCLQQSFGNNYKYFFLLYECNCHHLIEIIMLYSTNWYMNLKILEP